MSEASKQFFITTLKKVNRDGIDELVDVLTKDGFFESPASTKFHGNYDGGLLDHSVNVYKEAMYIYKAQCKLNPSIMESVTEDNIIVSSLLHDVCKCGLYKKIWKWRKDKDNKWEQYEAYEHDRSGLPIGHGEKSVIYLLLNKFELKENEILAIRWHMSAFDLSDYSDSKFGLHEAGDKTPLVSIIQCADMLASRILDVTKKETE